MNSLPALAAIRRDIRADVGADEEKIAIVWIFPNDVYEVDAARRKIVHDRLERLSEVSRDEEIRLEIVLAMVVERDVDSGSVEVRRLDATHPRLRRNSRENAS